MKANVFLKNIAILERKYHPKNPHHVPPIEIFGLSATTRMHELIKTLKKIIECKISIVGFSQNEIFWLYQSALTMEISRTDACTYDQSEKKFPSTEDAVKIAWQSFARMQYLTG